MSESLVPQPPSDAKTSNVVATATPETGPRKHRRASFICKGGTRAVGFAGPAAEGDGRDHAANHHGPDDGPEPPLGVDRPGRLRLRLRRLGHQRSARLLLIGARRPLSSRVGGGRLGRVARRRPLRLRRLDRAGTGVTGGGGLLLGRLLVAQRFHFLDVAVDLGLLVGGDLLAALDEVVVEGVDRLVGLFQLLLASANVAQVDRIQRLRVELGEGLQRLVVPAGGERFAGLHLASVVRVRGAREGQHHHQNGAQRRSPSFHRTIHQASQ